MNDGGFLSKFPTYKRIVKWMHSELKKQETHADNNLDLDDIDGDDQSQQPVRFPSQRSSADTSNWNNRVSVAPDGKQHIKDIGSGNIAIKK